MCVMFPDILKYPRTQHLEGSKLQPGDEDLSQIRFKDLKGKYIVIEEKIDGANAGIRFNPNDLDMLLQSRGHYLTGGPREKHFNLFKTWASCHEAALLEILQDRYQMFGEWMYAKHTVYYDNLPHYFFEFDVYDHEMQRFLSTEAREELLKGSPVVSVPVLYRGVCPDTLEEFLSYLKPSLYKTSSWKENLETQVKQMGLDFERVKSETSWSDLMEGVYIKIEDGDETIGRLKWVRGEFTQLIINNDSHWLSRPIIPNGLAATTNILEA